VYDLYWSGSAWVWADLGKPVGLTGISSLIAAYMGFVGSVVFARGATGYLYDLYWNGTAWVWEDQGTPPGATAITSTSAVFKSPAFGKLHVPYIFVIGDNGHLYNKHWDFLASAWVWEQVGMPASGVYLDFPNAVYWPTLDMIVVFATDSGGGHLYDSYLAGGPWLWQDQGEPR
jgi:hypothetical protein